MGDVLYSTKDSSPYDVAIVQLRDPTPEAVMPHLATSFQLGHTVTEKYSQVAAQLFFNFEACSIITVS